MMLALFAVTSLDRNLVTTILIIAIKLALCAASFAIAAIGGLGTSATPPTFFGKQPPT